MGYAKMSEYKMYIYGKPRNKDYNPMYKFLSFHELEDRVANNDNVPMMNEIVVEAYRDDNLINRGNTFSDTYNNIKLIESMNEDAEDDY